MPPTSTPAPTAPPSSSGHRFVVSVQARSKYYCDTDPAWHDLSQANLRWYNSESELKRDYPNLTLNKPCQ